MLDEEAGWESIGQFPAGINSDSYTIPYSIMQSFSYGFYTFQSFGTAITITPPFKYENNEISGNLSVSHRNLQSDMSCIWKGKVFYEFLQPDKSVLVVCDLKTHTKGIVRIKDLKKLRKKELKKSQKVIKDKICKKIIKEAICKKDPNVKNTEKVENTKAIQKANKRAKKQKKLNPRKIKKVDNDN